MAVSKGITFALDLGTPSCSRGPLTLDVGFNPAPGAMVPDGAPLTLDLEPLALGAHCLLIWSPCLLHGAPLALDLGPQLAPGAP